MIQHTDAYQSLGGIPRRHHGLNFMRWWVVMLVLAVLAYLLHLHIITHNHAAHNIGEY